MRRNGLHVNLPFRSSEACYRQSGLSRLIGISNCTMTGKGRVAKAAGNGILYRMQPLMLARMKSICENWPESMHELGLEPILYTVNCRFGIRGRKVLPTRRSNGAQSSSKSCRFDSGWGSAWMYVNGNAWMRCGRPVSGAGDEPNIYKSVFTNRFHLRPCKSCRGSRKVPTLRWKLRPFDPTYALADLPVEIWWLDSKLMSYAPTDVPANVLWDCVASNAWMVMCFST